MNMNGNPSSSQTLSPQMTAAQQQRIAPQYQQQAMQKPSLNKSMQDMMPQHQKQWTEHIAMTSQKNLVQTVPDSPNMGNISTGRINNDLKSK